jgi:hypothetical protein
MKTQEIIVNIRVSNIYKFAYVVDSYGFKFNPSDDTKYEDTIMYQTTDELGDLITSSKRGPVPMLYHLRYLTQLLSIQKYKGNPIFLEMCEKYCRDTIEFNFFKHTTPDKITKILESYNAAQWIENTSIKTVSIIPKEAMAFINTALQEKVVASAAGGKIIKIRRS